MCPAKWLNLLNPISFISYGLFVYSIINIFTGFTYTSNNEDSWYKRVYYSENPVQFIFTVSLNILFSLYLFDLVNQNIGIIKALNPLIKMFE